MNSWILIEDTAPPIDCKFLGWHKSEMFIICGAFTGRGWTDEAIKENLRLKEFTHWMLLIEPKQI
jgi:hypothetical protein